jgi:multiple antibiotic resistance protein
MKKELQAIVTILSLVNPAMCAALFMQIEKGQSSRARVADATKAIVVILTILLVAAFFGAQVLNLFGVSLDAFSVAGGGVLVWIGAAMLTGHGSATAPDHNVAEGAAAKPSLAPLILFAASPGTITGVITISVNHARLDIPITAITAVIVVLALTWALLLMTARMGDSEAGTSIVREMVTRYMGLIVIAMGIQFMLTGFKAFMGLG